MIRKIRWNNYNFLGDLELDFTKPDGTAYNTIILAGENGVGKTTILNSIATFLNRQSIIPFEFIEYAIDENIFQITPISQNAGYGFHNRKELSDGEEVNINSGLLANPDQINNDKKDIRHYGFAYSKARSGFNTNPVKAVTTQLVDNDKYEPDENDDFTRVKQLLIDIDGQDSSEWRKSCEQGGLNDKKYDDFKKQSRGYRFERAFNNFFNNIKYAGIDNDDPNEKKVMFEKHGHQISVDQLSTGEKQIVFRGAHLLRNINSITGGTVLIDEPELSMHPIWQKKILEYYRSLFTNNGVQTVQMIIATHSEYVIQSALKDRNNVLVIVLNDDNGVIRSKPVTAPNVLPSITAAETNYLAFGIPSTDYHIELYGYLQTKSGMHRINDCDQYITQQTQYITTKHEKIDNSFQGHHYQTLPTYIRNAIDHPDSGRSYTEEELITSIELLIDLCK
ncbi:MAG: AAA family ATPase [Ruminococcus sp.]|nr:AAA family ATPase [Ruminococcus sp.]